MIKRFKPLLYVSIPLLFLYVFYGQIQASKTIDVYNEITMVSGVREAVEGNITLNAGMTFIPGLGQGLELLVVPNINNAMLQVRDKYSEDKSLEIFKAMSDNYTKYVSAHGSSIYLYGFNSTVTSMLDYYQNELTFGKDSSVTLNSLNDFSVNSTTMMTLVILKIILFLVLVVLALVGYFTYRMEAIDKQFKFSKGEQIG